MNSRRRGLTLVEILIVVAIIAILVSMLLPAIAQTRSAARRAQCASNLKQLAQAVQTFHQRNERLPVYWGPMKRGGGEKFGGWLFHLLPDLDQQGFYDTVPTSTTTGTMYGVQGSENRSYSPKRWLPAVPASPDYNPGTWQEVVVGTAIVNGVQTTLTEWQLVGRVGQPGLPAREDTFSVTRLGTILVGSAGLAPQYATIARELTVPCLTDADDPGAVRSVGIPVTGNFQSLAGQQLTNYMPNAHVLTKFGTTRITTGSQAGLFDGPLFHRPADTIVRASWQHIASGSTGPIGRSFTNVNDGLTNTILIAEGMRQCDNLAQYRAAMFPSGNPMHEYGLGIECMWRDTTTGLLHTSGSTRPAYGNTLMFQTLPTLAQANPLRAQALHGAFLMVAMCDGSTRAISSLVERREPIGTNASGRENFDSRFYDPESRGATLPDGVWDMLMLPSDGQLLKNSGEVGREK